MPNTYTPVLSSVKLPSGNVYYFKDAWAREQIENIIEYSGYIGVTTTPLYDKCTTNPIVIGGNPVTAIAGNIAIYGDKEFIYAIVDIEGVPTGIWQEFGDLSAIINLLGKFAYNDTGYVNIQPKGTISAQVFSGQQGNIDIVYTPEGTIESTFTGSQGTVNVIGVPQGIIQIAEIIASLDGNYTPSGTITNNVNVSLSSATINNLTSVGTLPALTINTSNGGLLNAGIDGVFEEQLSLFYDPSMMSWSAGTLPTTSEISVVTDVDVDVDSTFSGTTVLISASFSGSSTTFSGSYTPSGSISSTFSGSSTTLSTTFTPSGSIGQATFTGTSESYTVYPTVDPDEGGEG